MTRSEVTRALLNAVRAPRKGIMLDTSRLMHTNPGLQTQEEALAYIHRCLDAHGALCSWIRGVHLHQSLTGDSVRRMLAEGVDMSGDYWTRLGRVFTHVFDIDRHEPFDAPGVRRLIERLSPDYLTHEFITRSRAEHERFLCKQQAALGMVSEG